MTEKNLWVEVKSTYIDVTLHAEFSFDIIFGRWQREMVHMKNTFFMEGFLKDIVGLSKGCVRVE